MPRWRCRPRTPTATDPAGLAGPQAHRGRDPDPRRAADPHLPSRARGRDPAVHRAHPQGLEVEPSVITDYSGFTALAYHAGSATGSDGRRYDLETDIRAMEGSYVAEDGSRKRALFAGL
jgi:hypothetical protein